MVAAFNIESLLLVKYQKFYRRVKNYLFYSTDSLCSLERAKQSNSTIRCPNTVTCHTAHCLTGALIVRILCCIFK